MKINYKVRVKTAPWLRGYEVWILKSTVEAGIGEKEFCFEMGRTVEQWNEITPITYGIPATCSLNEESVQKLMDDLWNAGVRPTDAGDNAGALSATKKHLEDMRKIAFNKLELDIGE